MHFFFSCFNISDVGTALPVNGISVGLLPTVLGSNLHFVKAHKRTERFPVLGILGLTSRSTAFTAARQLVYFW